MKQVDQITGKKNTMGIIEQLAEIKAEEALAKGLVQGEQKGRLEAKLEEKENFVIALLNNTEFSADKIASMVGAPVPFVEKVKRGLISK